jgi:hypothetical protein
LLSTAKVGVPFLIAALAVGRSRLSWCGSHLCIMSKTMGALLCSPAWPSCLASSAAVLADRDVPVLQTIGEGLSLVGWVEAAAQSPPLIQHV